MTIDEMIERPEEFRDQLGGEADVRLMTQQHWPFENNIDGLASGEEINEAANDTDEESDGSDVAEDTVVYIVEGGQLGYLSTKSALPGITINPQSRAEG
jgi:hypothetical protein